MGWPYLYLFARLQQKSHNEFLVPAAKSPFYGEKRIRSNKCSFIDKSSSFCSCKEFLQVKIK